jgi:hypothetical protein
MSMIRRMFSIAQTAQLGVCVAFSVLLCGCESQIFFQSNFSPTQVGQPPAYMQAVGTAGWNGPQGSVLVEPDPLGGSQKWIQVSRFLPPPVSLVAFQGRLSAFAGDGTYIFAGSFFVPGPGIDVAVSSETSLGSVQFESYAQAPSEYQGFTHLDFLANGKIRIDDDSKNKEFGTYPFGKPFDLFVTLNIGETPTAHVELIGNGAAGEMDYTIADLDSGFARQFGAVRLWLGTQWDGSFEATDIVVARKGCWIHDVFSSIRCSLPQFPTTLKAAQ